MLPTLEELIFANAQMGEALTEALVNVRTLLDRLEREGKGTKETWAAIDEARAFLQRIDAATEDERPVCVQSTIEPIPNDCLPFDGDEQKLLELLRGPQVVEGKLAGGVWDGMTPEQVLAECGSYRRLVGE